MKKNLIYGGFFLTVMFYASCTNKNDLPEKVVLKDNWTIQTSAEVKVTGDVITSGGFDPGGWYSTSMPSTVLAALVKNKVYPDPYYGTNIESLPGYVSGRMETMPANSPYNIPWWYRTEFMLPDDYKGKNIWLHVPGVNYKTNVWLNGHLIADTTTVIGAYRYFDLDLSKYAMPGDTNRLAFEVFAPRKKDLTITWVDWNPTPPDKAMGFWYDMSIYATGRVVIKHPHIITDLNLPATDTARLTVSAELINNEKNRVTGKLTGIIEDIRFSKVVKLKPGENKIITFTSRQYPQLVIPHPRLWWPNYMGPQNLYDLNLSFEMDGSISDNKNLRFGIREITSHISHFDEKRTRLFQVNGKNILIRGGGYVEDMMLRPSKKNVEAAVRYAKHMNLNTLRMEGTRGPDYLYDLCDEEGILVMVGWCCCSTWERWKEWTPQTAQIAEESWRDQIVRLRNHPSVFTWLYGSDNYPPADIEKKYIGILDEYDGTRPYESSATQDSSAIAGYTGFWMGPYPPVYAYFPPSYWYGKLEFNTECSPGGEQIPPLESLRKMMPEKDLWPMSSSWDIRLHKIFYPDAREALYSRYGQPQSVEEYCMKSQVFQEEATRAMFEAFARNKYRSGGVIYWMYNSAWPSLYWQLYDYFQTPNGAFYGTRKACEPLHIQYSYDNKSVSVVNGLYRSFKNLKASVKVYNFDMQSVYHDETAFDITGNESKKVMDINWSDDLSAVYFVKLKLNNEQGKELSSNFYWLSNKGDENADFTALDKLPEVDLRVSVSVLEKKKDKYVLSVEIENTSSSLAFAVNPKIVRERSGDLVTPVYWDDNYFSLLPKEKRSVTVEFSPEDLNGEHPVLTVGGWNVKDVNLPIL